MPDPETPEVPIEEVPPEEPVAADPPVTKEESLLQSANENMDEVDDQPSRGVVSAPLKKSHKKLFVGLLAAIVTLGIAVGAWALLTKKSSTATSPSKTSTQQSTTTEPAELSYTPVNIAYAFRANATDPYVIYYRPAAGGERKEALKLDRDETVTQTDARGEEVAVATTNALYVSRDSGKSYTKIFSVSGTEQITGVRIATSRKNLLYALAAGDLTSNTVKSIDFNGKNEKDIATIDAAGVRIYGWNDSKNQFFYSKGCTSCDGAPSSYEMFDVKTKKSQPFNLKTAATNYLQQVAISDDFSKVATVNAVPADSSDALSAGVAPYSVLSYDVAAAKLSTVTTIGTKGETNPNGTAKTRTVIIGFQAGTNKLYYAEGTKITLNGASLATTELPLLSVEFVGQKAVIASTQKAEGDSILSNYNLGTGKATQIFEGDANTTIVGVTTK
jgi:hypothetical protein